MSFSSGFPSDPEAGGYSEQLFRDSGSRSLKEPRLTPWSAVLSPSRVAYSHGLQRALFFSQPSTPNPNGVDAGRALRSHSSSGLGNSGWALCTNALTGMNKTLDWAYVHFVLSQLLKKAAHL